MVVVMRIIRPTWVRRADLQANPQRLYLFGDNEARAGFGGQAAEMRGEPNAVGIRTKAAPHRGPSAYWTDATYERNREMIDEDLAPVVAHWAAGGEIAIPADGLGTGLSNLPNTAPRTYAYLEARLAQLASSSDPP